MRCMPAEGARLPVPVTLRGELGVCWLCVLNVRVQRNGVCVWGGMLCRVSLCLWESSVRDMNIPY